MGIWGIGEAGFLGSETHGTLVMMQSNCEAEEVPTLEMLKGGFIGQLPRSRGV
jgi:hypothetical protein